MTIKGYRAVYGDSSGAHGLLNSAAKIRAAAETIQIFTDNARQQPNKFVPQPFYRGLPQNDYYVLIKTYLDETASRPGMVFSEALFYPLDEAIRSSDFSALLFPFSASLTEAKKSNVTEFSVSTKISEDNTKPKVPKGLTSLLNALLASDSTKPPVWIGEDNFLEVLTAYWNAVPETFRRNFLFRFCYVPQDFDRFPPVLIYAPTELAARWVQYPRIQPQQQAKEDEVPQGEAVAYLLESERGENLKEFLAASGAEVEDWQSLRMAEQCAGYIEKLSSDEITISEFRGLLARIAVLSPDENTGAEFKTRMFNRFCDALSEKGTVDDIFALNNFLLLPFPKSSAALSKSVGSWFAANFWRLMPEELLKLLGKSAENGGANVWDRAVIDAVEKITGKDLDQKNALTLWKWWESSDTLFELTKDYLSSAKLNDSLLSESCPRVLNKTLGAQVKEFARKEKFWQLHAAALTAYLSPLEAITEQLKVEPARTAKSSSGLPILLARIELEAILDDVLTKLDKRLLKPLAERVVKNARLLRRADLTKDAWQDLALAMLEADAATFWKNIQKPQEKVFQIFDLLISGDLAEQQLVNFIADSEFADVSCYQKRQSLWQHLPARTQPKFLTATADAWWKNFNERVNSGDVPEQPLLDYLWTDDKIEDQIRGSENAVNELLKIYQAFPGLSEEYFVRKLTTALRRQSYVDQITAISLGKYVRSCDNRRCAKEILRAAENANRQDLYPALRECKNLFSFWDRFLSSILSSIVEAPVTWDDWWKAFKELLFERYPDGPAQSNIWKKAGGHNSDLLKKVSGRDAWEDAIQKMLANRAGSKINTPKLLDEIHHEYPSDDKIKLLAKLFYEDLNGRY